MDYLITFDDGSEALMHYGVKGMKWRKHKAKDTIDEEIIPEQFIEEQRINEQMIPEKRISEKFASTYTSEKQANKSPLQILKNGLTGAKKLASSKLSEAGSAIKSGKSRIDNYLKYRGNKATTRMDIRVGSGEYDSETHLEALKNGRRRSWVQDVKGTANTKSIYRKTRTPEKVLQQKPSDRISDSTRRWFDASRRNRFQLHL